MYVVTCTTQQLQKTFAEAERIGHALIGQPSFLGGRDWVVFFQDEPANPEPAHRAPCVNGSFCGAEEHCPPKVGWVEDMAQRHARFVAAVGEGTTAWPTLSTLGITVPDGAVTLVEPEVEWGDVRYGRYDTSKIPGFSGWVEDAARSWIVFLGPHGAPAVYFPRRDADGGVIGEPIDLTA